MPFIPDSSQKEIINIKSGNHLVLAPPGCGKTQILAERIRIALDNGVKPEDMICLTFTNRAARGMRERINENVGEERIKDVFVGNVHRFCSRFLFTNNLVPAESAIIDDDTTNSILARYMNEDEEKVAHNYRRKKAYSQIVFYSHFMYDIEHGVPKELRMHPECVTREDIAVMRELGKSQDKPFDAAFMTDVYNNTDFYLDLIHQPMFLPVLRHEAEQSLMKMRYAHAYSAYKELNNLLDFEDLLQLTYNALKNKDNTDDKNNKEKNEDNKSTDNNDISDVLYKKYSWVQVDEVQDLNSLQLAIIEALSRSSQCDGTTVGRSVDSSASAKPSTPCVSLFLGDEQQAIFSFMGAKLATLNILKEKCKGNIHHLYVNHRTPPHLLTILNEYAIANLHTDPEFLPTPIPESERLGVGSILPFDNIWAEFKGVAKKAAKLLKQNSDETVAIIVNSNNDADEVSKNLEANNVPHFKISGTDIFSTPEVKLLLAHLNVLHNGHDFLAWARIINGLRVCETPASARQFVHQLRKYAVTPSEFLTSDKTYIQQFVDIYDSQDIVVFDTETTGLNVFEDDIIQIAAERIRQGQSVEKFSVYIDTDKAIPEMLGDIVNPIIEERKHQKIYPHDEALKMFLDFVGDSALLAHNANFDWHIMDYNIQRYLPSVDWKKEHAVCIDSLRLIRQLRPDLKAFKLKVLLKELGLSGENSHLADDDVNATVSLLKYCYEKGKEMMPLQKQYLERKTTIDKIAKLRRNYRYYYVNGIKRLYIKEESEDNVPALVNELNTFYEGLKQDNLIKPIEKIGYIIKYLSNDVIDSKKDPSLMEQLDKHIMEIDTFKEADLCGSSTIEDRLFVSTIHKAKGLEFDNVIVFDVVDGRIPNFYNENNPAMLQEDARKLYVAMSRAKKRLFICWSRQAQNNGVTRQLSRFLKPVTKYF